MLSGLNVLIVDDDSDTLTLMAKLSKTARERDRVSRSRSIQAITLKRPDVLVSDIAMPDEDGYGLIKEDSIWLENGSGKCSGGGDHGVREGGGS